MGVSRKRDTPFQKQHEAEYALEVTVRDMKGAADSVQCLFCVYRGREARSESDTKRRRTENVMIWTRPFRPELFRQHHQGQHPIGWEDYQSLSLAEKKRFFDKDKRGSLHAFVDRTSEHLKFKIQGPVVDVVIADMFFHPEEDEDDDDSEPITKANALKLFQREPDGSYSVIIKNPLRFNLALAHVSVGLSFRQTARVITQHRNFTKNAKLSGLNDHMVGQFVRILVGVNLNTISNILVDADVWCFSIAADCSTHFGVSFLDIRARVCVAGVLHNLHLAVIPFFDRHTAANIFDHIVRLLEVLLPNWRDKLLSVSSDGENTMTGRHAGVVTLLENAASNKILRIWCVPHQVDLVIKAITKDLDGEQFYKIAHAFSVHLRAQVNLITEMNSKCPKDTTRWLAFGSMLEWMLNKRLPLLNHIRSKRPVQAPSDSWWVIAAALCPLYKACNVVMTTLQSPEMVISQQRVEIRNLILNLTDNLDVRMVESDTSFNALPPTHYVVDGLFWMNKNSVCEHIKDQVSWILTHRSSFQFEHLYLYHIRDHGLATY